MKTLQIGLEWFPERGGGLDRVYYDLIRHLPEVGVRVSGLVVGSANVATDSRSLVQAFAYPNAPLWQRWIGERQSVHRLLQVNDYDLIASHFALYTFPVLDKLADRPLVVHFHGPWALESTIEGNKPLVRDLKKSLEKICYKRAAKFIVLSQSFRDTLHQEYQIPLDRIHIVPGGVDPERFNLTLSPHEARITLGWSQDRPIIFCVRRLAKRMGLENLITAIAQVRLSYPDILLYIAGTGAISATLQAQVEALELQKNVQLLGYLPEEQLPLAYRAANFSVVPTVAFEGFGLILIESLATGTPVLGTPVGGIPETLQPFCQDLLFESSSTHHLTQGIKDILSGQRQLPSSQACQAYVQKNYAWSAIAPKIKAVYETALKY